MVFLFLKIIDYHWLVHFRNRIKDRFKYLDTILSLSINSDSVISSKSNHFLKTTKKVNNEHIVMHSYFSGSASDTIPVTFDIKDSFHKDFTRMKPTK